MKNFHVENVGQTHDLYARNWTHFRGYSDKHNLLPLANTRATFSIHENTNDHYSNASLVLLTAINIVA